MKKILSVLESIAVICVAIASVVVLWSMRSDGGRTQAADQVVQDISSSNLDMVPPYHVLQTQSNTTLQLVEFSDFQCPFCGKYANETFSKIKRELIDTGKLSYGFVHFPLSIHADAISAAEASECASDEGKFWEMHDALFSNQNNLKTDGLMRAAALIGLKTKVFEACLESGSSERLARNIEEGKRLNVSATPTFFVGEKREDGKISLKRRIRGAVSYETFSKTIDEVRALTIASVHR